ncbi:MAG TPA: glycosyltransferase [Solirubrobacterales bacterium]|jgi:glycosyltransferase involved in cell wall biosynthesis
MSAKLSISAVMPVYNGEEFVAEALDTVLSQTRPPDEVVVVDDGSTDGTPDVLAGFGKEIRVVRQVNQGVWGAMNTCFREARCDYIAKCDADDLWAPEKLEAQAAVVAGDPAIDVTFAEARVFGNYAGRWGMPLNGVAAGPLEARRLGEVMFVDNPICPSTTFVRRAMFERVGGFRDTRCEDYDFWMRAIDLGARFHYDPATLVHYRRHDSNVTTNKLAVHESNLMVRKLNSHLVAPRLARKLIAEDLFSVGRDLSDADRSAEASHFYRESLKERFTPKAAAWLVICAAPAAVRRPLADRLVAAKRSLSPSPLSTDGS